MDSIVAQNQTQSTLNTFFDDYNIGQTLRSCNFYKHAGISPQHVLGYLM